VLQFEPLGAAALLGTVVGYIAGYFYGKLYVGQYLALMIIVGLLALCAEAILGVITLGLYQRFDPVDFTWIGINMVASFPLFYFCEFLMRPRQRSRYYMHIK
jgi:hypothetical protein